MRGAAGNPMAVKIGNSAKVLSSSEPMCLEATHLARRGGAATSSVAADNPAHRRIMPQTQGVVYDLVAGKATKYRLPEQASQGVPTILASACVGERLARHDRQAECIVEFAIG